MSSQDGTSSFQQITHGLSGYPDRVKVLVKQDDDTKNNYGYIFEGSGGAQTDDDLISRAYGGVVFAYDDVYVRLWAPDQNNGNANGRMIRIGDGWGGEQNTVNCNDAQVRIFAWEVCDFCRIEPSSAPTSQPGENFF